MIDMSGTELQSAKYDREALRDALKATISSLDDAINALENVR
jgi:hypothetical protein